MAGATDAVALSHPELGALMRLKRPLVAVIVVVASAGAGYVGSLIWPMPMVSDSAMHSAPTGKISSTEPEPKESTPPLPTHVSKPAPTTDAIVSYDFPPPSQPSAVVTASLPQKAQTEVRGTSTSSPQLVRRRASSGSRRTSAGWWTRRTQGEHERHQERAPRGRPTEGSERESVSHCARPGNRRSTVQRCGVCSQSPRQPGSARFHGAPIEELVSIGPQSTASNLRPPMRTGATPPGWYCRWWRRRGRPVVGQHIGAAPGVGALAVGGEPGAFLDRHGALGDAVGHARRQHDRAEIVEHAHEIAVGDARAAGVRRVQPDVVAVDAAEHRLVAVDRVRPRPRLRRQQLERIGRALAGRAVPRWGSAAWGRGRRGRDWRPSPSSRSRSCPRAS